jgi:serine phosphatase RsbU (regulator of sigma subunit)
MSVLYEPADLIGGDALSAIPLDCGCVGLYMADAMGHGVAAALLMSVVTASFRMAIAQGNSRHGCSPARVLQQVNESVVGLFEMSYVTAFCCVLDPGGGRMVYSVAGHPPGLVRRAAGGVDELGCEGGIPLGIENGTIYRDVELDFAVGDLLVLYPDGVVEATANDGTQFGLSKLKELLASDGLQAADRVTESLHDRLMDHCHGRNLQDDVTVLAVHRVS